MFGCSGWIYVINFISRISILTNAKEKSFLLCAFRGFHGFLKYQLFSLIGWLVASRKGFLSDVGRFCCRLHLDGLWMLQALLPAIIVFLYPGYMIGAGIVLIPDAYNWGMSLYCCIEIIGGVAIGYQNSYMLEVHQNLGTITPGKRLPIWTWERVPAVLISPFNSLGAIHDKISFYGGNSFYTLVAWSPGILLDCMGLKKERM